jgi:hypothetical protein
MEFLSPFRSVLTASLMVSDDRVAHLGRNPFADNDGMMISRMSDTWVQASMVKKRLLSGACG